METMQEIIPFAKEMLSQKPNRNMLKLYLFGSVVAFLGTVLGLVETVCQPFSSNEPLDAELAILVAREQRALEAEERRKERVEMEKAAEEVTIPKKQKQAQRSVSHRLHAS